MPYKSRAQAGKFHAMAKRGEIDPETVEEFDKASAGKKLPYKVKGKKKRKKARSSEEAFAKVRKGHGLAY